MTRRSALVTTKTVLLPLLRCLQTRHPGGTFAIYEAKLPLYASIYNCHLRIFFFFLLDPKGLLFVWAFGMRNNTLVLHYHKSTLSIVSIYKSQVAILKLVVPVTVYHNGAVLIGHSVTIAFHPVQSDPYARFNLSWLP